MLTQAEPRAEILIKIGETGIQEKLIVADSDSEEMAGHRLLAKITPALRLFEASIRVALLTNNSSNNDSSSTKRRPNSDSDGTIQQSRENRNEYGDGRAGTTTDS